MAEVKIMVGGRQYAVHCRDGEEAQLHYLADMISDRVSKVSGSSGGLTEVRQLLYAALLLADELEDQRKAPPPPPPPVQSAPPPPPLPPPPIEDLEAIAAIERLAVRAEALADNLAAQRATA